MALVRWEPTLKTLSDLRNEMDRIFETFFGERFPAFKEEFSFTPAIEVSETDSEIIVKAAVPGIDKKDLNISILDNNLIIKGEIKREKEEKKKNYYKQEIAYGSFSRTIPLPAEVKVDEVKANMKNGIVTITIPKSEKAKAKEITINVE
jgi:HSP20 family protein